MKQMILKLLLCICMSVLCQGCVEDQTTTIIVASDLHYLSTSLFDDGEAFTSLVEHAVYRRNCGSLYGRSHRI